MTSNNNQPYPSECPMNENYTPPAKETPQETQQAYPSECPMNEDYKAPKTDTKIDPTNMMPPPNQRPSPDQPFPLDTARVSSSIPKFAPKGEEDQTWQYPSPQMFWNAMLRKGWRWQDDAPEQETMNNIISIHNVNNERAWREVLMWETAYHSDECDWRKVKLKKFSGKAKDFSWRAKMRGWMGYPLPFDRHDWIIDRCGKERTYVIDYYDNDEIDHSTYQFSFLDVRPHPRNVTDYYFPEALYDRAKATTQRWFADFQEMWTGKSDYVGAEILDDLKAVKKSPTSVVVNPEINPTAPGKVAVNVHEPTTSTTATDQKS